MSISKRLFNKVILTGDYYATINNVGIDYRAVFIAMKNPPQLLSEKRFSKQRELYNTVFVKRTLIMHIKINSGRIYTQM